MSIVLTEYAEVQLCVDATQASGGAVAGVLNAAKLILYTNALAPTPTTQVADLTQPTYTGYAPASVTWGAAFRDALGNIVTLSSPVVVQETGTPVAVTIMGWGLTDSGGTHLLMAELLPTPLHLVDLLSLFELIVPFNPGAPDTMTVIVVS